jgi:hypothetical protein
MTDSVREFWDVCLVSIDIVCTPLKISIVTLTFVLKNTIINK